MSRHPKTQLELAGDGCEVHGGTGGALYFHGRCHPRAPAWVVYLSGVLTIRCSVCEMLVADVAVDPGPCAEERLDALLAAKKRAQLEANEEASMDGGDYSPHHQDSYERGLREGRAKALNEAAALLAAGAADAKERAQGWRARCEELMEAVKTHEEDALADFAEKVRALGAPK